MTNWQTNPRIDVRRSAAMERKAAVVVTLGTPNRRTHRYTLAQPCIHAIRIVANLHNRKMFGDVMIGNSENGGPAIAPHYSTETHVRQVFALTQGNTPQKSMLDQKIGQPAKTNLKKALFSRYVASKVFCRFLKGSDREDRHHKNLLDNTVVAREALRLIANKDDPGPLVDPAPNDQLATMSALCWRAAFFMLWSNVGAPRNEIIRRIGRLSDDGPDSETVLQAIADLEKIDMLVGRGELAGAFLLARDRLVDGFTFTASRYLAIGLRLCPDPAKLQQMIARYGEHCSDRLVSAIQREGVRMLMPATEIAIDATSDDITPQGISFEGDLPSIYDVKTREVLSFDPARATIWAALERPTHGFVDIPSATFGAVVIFVADEALDELGRSAAEIGAMCEAGLVVVAVISEKHPLRSAFTEISGLKVVSDMESAQDTTAEGPILVCDSVVPVPVELFNVLARDDAHPVPVRLELVTPGEAAGSAGHHAIASWSSRICGLYAHSAQGLWNSLSAAGNDPVAAAQALEADGSGQNPLQIFAIDPAPQQIASIPIEGILVRLDDKNPLSVPTGIYALDLHSDAVGHNVADRLSELAVRSGLGQNTPVVVQTAAFTYDVTYVDSIFRRFQIYTGDLPIAVRGLRLRSDDGRPEFIDADYDNGLFRCAPLGLSCLSLEAALDYLRRWGDRPAHDCVIPFNPPAAAWAEGRKSVRGAWGGILDQMAKDPEAMQTVFDAGRFDMGRAIEQYERRKAGAQETTALPLPLQVYIRMQETARQLMRTTLQSSNGRSSPNADDALETLLQGPGLRTLLADGHGLEIGKFLTALLPSLGRRNALTVKNGRALIDLAEICGLQTVLASALAPAALSLCTRNVFWIRPLFQFLGKFSRSGQVIPILFASLGREAAADNRISFVTRLSLQIAEACDREDLELTLHLLDDLLGASLVECPDTLKVFGHRLLLESDIDLDTRLTRSGLRLADFVAMSNAEARLKIALVRKERSAVLAALRCIGEEDGNLSRAIETIRLCSVEIARLKITSSEWHYPFLADRHDIMVMATILGDTKRLHDLEPEPSNAGEAVVEYDPRLASGPHLRHAVGRMAMGDPTNFNKIFASWASDEGIRPIVFPSLHDSVDKTTHATGVRAETGCDGVVALFEAISRNALPEQVSERGDKVDMHEAGGHTVSAIVTTFNADPDLLHLSLTSILKQSWQDLEILLVDDGSEPELRGRTRAMEGLDPRIRFLETSQNGGPYLARNLALEAARGAFVAIQDADDYSHPDRFARQIDRLRNRPEALASEAGHMRFDGNGRLQFLRNLHVVDDGPMSTMFRRKTFDQLGPFAATRSRGDVEYRERIRQAMGPLAFDQTRCPMVFCFGAPGTLSQRIASQNGDALRTFRHTFGRRRWIKGQNGTPVPVGALTIPKELQP